jgi:hypothetical protein
MSCIVVLPIEEADTLVYNIERMYSKMTAADMIVLRAEVEKLKIWIDEFCHGIFYISSLLSGSEVQFLVWQRLAELWLIRFGININVKLALAVECVPHIQEWIQEYGRPEALYPDVHDLRGKVHDVVGGLALCVFGIECDTVSGLHNGWQNLLSCVSDDSERTGASAISCLEFVTSNRIASWVGECVKNLNTKDSSTGKSPADIIIEISNRRGWIVWSQAVEGQEHGDPESRPRFWMYGQFVGVAESQKQQDKQWQHPRNFVMFAQHMINMRIDALPIDAYLLPERHPSILRQTLGLSAKSIEQDAPAAQPKPPKRTKKLPLPDESVAEAASGDSVKVETYMVDHLEAYGTASPVGIQWPPVLPDLFLAKMVGGFATSRRMQELIWFDEQVRGAACDLTDGLVVRDANLSKSWGCAKLGQVPCIAQSSVMYVRGLQRYRLSKRFGLCKRDKAQETLVYTHPPFAGLASFAQLH